MLKHGVKNSLNKTKMPKIQCKCGYVIEDVSIPNPQGKLLISETILDKIESDSFLLKQVFDELADKGVQVYECPDCHRMVVFPEGKGGTVLTYALESN